MIQCYPWPYKRRSVFAQNLPQMREEAQEEEFTYFAWNANIEGNFNEIFSLANSSSAHP